MQGVNSHSIYPVSLAILHWLRHSVWFFDVLRLSL